MIILPRHQCIFYHTPKTGGTSLQNAFSEVITGIDAGLVIAPRSLVSRVKSGAVVYRPRRRPEGLTNQAWRKKITKIDWLIPAVRSDGQAKFLKKHSNASEAKDFFTTKYYSEMQKKTIVRNPYSRTYSAYKYTIKEHESGPRHEPRFIRNGKPISFDEYVETGLCLDVLASMPQVLWYDKDDTRFSFIRNENLSVEISYSVYSLGFSIEDAERFRENLGNSRKNRSTHIDEWKGMSPLARKGIEMHYAEDFETFGY